MNGASGRLQLDFLEVVVDDVVGHAAWQCTPHLARHQARDLAGGQAELEELLHPLMEAGPLVAVAVVAGVEERHPAAPRLLELVRQLVEHRGDFRLVLVDAAGMEADVAGDAGGRGVLAVVLTVLEQAGEENLLDALGGQNTGCLTHLSFLQGCGQKAGSQRATYFRCNHTHKSTHCQGLFKGASK